MSAVRTLETQRDALLRLLAGWLAVIEFVSCGPIAVPLPRWARAFFDTLLIRAELAAHYLLFASASLQAKRSGAVLSGVVPDRFSGVEGRIPDARCADGLPSTDEIRRRMVALRCLLTNLQRRALRLMRKRSARFCKPLRSVRCARVRPRHLVKATRRWIAPRITRPPDKFLPAV